MKKIYLTQGKCAVVDDDDFDFLNKFKWHAFRHRKVFYAARTVNLSKTDKKRILMHRQITGLNDKVQQVDHINGDGLDNRKENLRIATNSQNQANKKVSKNNKTGLKGVSPIYTKGYFCGYKAQISHQNKVIYLGCFPTPEDAHEVYKQAAKKYHGEFAKW